MVGARRSNLYPLRNIALGFAKTDNRAPHVAIAAHIGGIPIEIKAFPSSAEQDTDPIEDVCESDFPLVV